ncbi:MAG: spore cortex biosynthesis protein YabQ [Ruminococcus sp.]|nr:spore cortex biosynthesis protein YabQ [Ruminococcus sp.]
MQIPDTFLTIHEETLLFLASVLLGCGLGILFDLLRTLRILLPHKSWFVALEDVLFLLVWAGAVVSFTSVLAKGDLRMYYILGSSMGFVLYRLLLGNPVTRLLRRIFGWILRLLGWIFRPVTAVLVRIHRKCKNKFVGSAKNLRKDKNIWSALLIAPREMLYNKHKNKGKQGERNLGSQKECKAPEGRRRKRCRKKEQAEKA